MANLISTHENSLQATDWLAQGQESKLDCESGVQLRCYLGPILENADSWRALIAALQGKGFNLVFSDSRLVLQDGISGACICTSRFLGAPLRELVTRLGRPKLRINGPAAAHICGA